MKRILILTLFLGGVAGYTCTKDVHHYLTVRNESQKAIIASFADYFPDTTLRCPLFYAEIAVNNEHKLFLRGGWEDELKYRKYYQIFVIDSVVHKTYPCDTIRKYNLVLKHYKLTLDDVRNLNWTITYP